MIVNSLAATRKNFFQPIFPTSDVYKTLIVSNERYSTSIRVVFGLKQVPRQNLLYVVCVSVVYSSSGGICWGLCWPDSQQQLVTFSIV